MNADADSSPAANPATTRSKSRAASRKASGGRRQPSGRKASGHDVLETLRHRTNRPDISAEQLGQTLDIVATGETLTEACKRLNIDRSSVAIRLLDVADETLNNAYARATQLRAEALADKIANVADEVVMAKDSTAVNALRLRVDALKWVASKLLPKVYGDYAGAPQAQTLQIGTVGELHLTALRQMPGEPPKLLTGSTE